MFSLTNFLSFYMYHISSIKNINCQQTPSWMRILDKKKKKTFVGLGNHKKRICKLRAWKQRVKIEKKKKCVKKWNKRKTWRNTLPIFPWSARWWWIGEKMYMVWRVRSKRLPSFLALPTWYSTIFIHCCKKNVRVLILSLMSLICFLY